MQVPLPGEGRGGILGVIGILERIRAVANPQQQAQDLQEAVMSVERARVRLYLDEQTVEDQFVQRRGALDEVGTGGEISGGAEASYLGFVSGKAERKTTASESVKLTPFIKALLLEDAERERGNLLDLSVEDPLDGPLLYFVGRGRIFSTPEPVIELPELGLSGEAAEALENERKMQAPADAKGMIVLVGGGQTTFAAIASASRSVPGLVASYRQAPPFGLLGIWERQLAGLTLIKPLFIWRQAPNPQ